MQASKAIRFITFETIEDLANALHDLILPISQEFDIEIGAHMYSVEGGGYFASELFTDFLSGRINTTTSNSYLVPGLDSQLSGFYHTHGGYVYDGVNDFSTGDFNFSSIMVLRSKNYNYKSYMSSPTGMLSRYDAGRYLKDAENANIECFDCASRLSRYNYISILRQ